MEIKIEEEIDIAINERLVKRIVDQNGGKIPKHGRKLRLVFKECLHKKK